MNKVGYTFREEPTKKNIHGKTNGNTRGPQNLEIRGSKEIRNALFNDQ